MSTSDLPKQPNLRMLESTADEPNLPEVSGTSFPLLTTVLAGFAVTIAVQLIIRPESAETLPVRITAAIIIFLASTLFFISSIVFAVNAQGHNYLPFIDLSDDGRRLIGVDEHAAWISWLHRGWNAFHVAGVATFYGGILLLLAGVNLIVWEFVGPGVAAAFFALIIGNLALTITIGLKIRGTQERTKRGVRRQVGETGMTPGIELPGNIVENMKEGKP